jgi:hypothetical protein
MAFEDPQDPAYSVGSADPSVISGLRFEETRVPAHQICRLGRGLRQYANPLAEGAVPGWTVHIVCCCCCHRHSPKPQTATCTRLRMLHAMMQKNPLIAGDGLACGLEAPRPSSARTHLHCLRGTRPTLRQCLKRPSAPGQEP